MACPVVLKAIVVRHSSASCQVTLGISPQEPNLTLRLPSPDRETSRGGLHTQNNHNVLRISSATSQRLPWQRQPQHQQLPLIINCQRLRSRNGTRKWSIPPPPMKASPPSLTTIFSTLSTLPHLTYFLLLLLISKQTHTTALTLQPNPNPKTTPAATSPSQARAHNFIWAPDTSLTEVVSIDEIRRGETKHIYVTREFHYIHCAHTWDMQLLTFYNSRLSLESLADLEHGRHFSKLLIDHVLPRNETLLTVVGELCSHPVRQEILELEACQLVSDALMGR